MRRIYSFLAITLLSLMVLTGCNSAENKTSSAGPIAPQTPASRAAPTDGIRRITVVELRELLAKNEAVVIDVRNQEAYNLSHIQGAKLIPVADTLKHIDELPKDKLIVTYCA
ncbi:MAG: rhodanese-like domain-containing protein [Pyrinomonadaceae bacterium]|nr:rhodanese-like domain-containing protein [Pyrinomonadaceae bacterium]